MPPKETKDEVIRVRVDPDLKTASEKMAEELGESLSVILRQLLRGAIADWKRTQEEDKLKSRRYPVQIDPDPTNRLNEDPIPKKRLNDPK